MLREQASRAGVVASRAHSASDLVIAAASASEVMVRARPSDSTMDGALVPVKAGLRLEDLAHCGELLRVGSKSFASAARLLPARVRPQVTAFYAFCRVADDAIDDSEDPTSALALLHRRVDAIYEGRPHDDPVDRAFAWVVWTAAIPRPLVDTLLEGFEWDLEPTLGTQLTPRRPGVVRVVAWNVERGKRFAELRHALVHDPLLREADLLLLTEVDIGMGRSQNLNVPREIAAALGMGYVFANYHIVLAEGDRGERGHGVPNTKAMHGCALLTRFPVLLDELLNPAVLYAPPGPEALAAEVRQMLSRVPEGDHEAHLLVLRQFKQINVLRVAAADVSGALPLMVVSDHLTAIAETLLHEALVQAWADVTVRHGLPRCVVDGVARTAGFAIIAYGKLGGLELGYGSDLDLVFLHDSAGEEQETDGERPLDNATFFARLAQRLIHVLTAPTGAGVLYEIDTRLRPSGRAGMMVASIDGYAAYQRAGAWTWEHQALVRARPVTGSAAIAERFCALRQEVLARVREPAVLRREVREMREKMREHLGSRNPAAFHLKQDRGGMADIEFIVQYLVLAHTAEEPILVRYTDNVRQLAALEATGILRSADANLLRDAYRQLRRRAHLAKLRDEPATITGDELKPYRDGVERLWQRIMEAED